MLAVCGSTRKAHAEGGEAASKEAPEASEEYSAQLSLRPLTLPQGMTQATLSGGYRWMDDEPKIASVSIRAKVGITARWDVSVKTLARVKPDVEWVKGASLATKILAYDSARLDFAPGLHVNFGKADYPHLLPGVALDATTRIYILNRKSERFSKVLSVACGDGSLALAVGRRASLNLNCSIVAQGNRGYGARISAQLFHLRLNGDVRESTFLNALPAVTYFHSIGSWMDFAATYASGGGYEAFFGSVAIRH